MKILSCHIDAFGKFKNVDFNFDQMTTFCEKNGFGKTTLAMFLKAMFYSLPASSKRTAVKSERDLYRPINYDGTFGGRLTFSCKKGVFVVIRQFSSTPTLDKFAFFDAKTNLQSNAFSSNLGEELFGVGRDTFENTIFFGQKDLPSGINDDIRANLSTGVLSGDDIDNYEKTQTKIQKRLSELRADLRALKLDEAKNEMNKLEGRGDVLDAKLKNVEDDLQDLESTKSQLYSSINSTDFEKAEEFKNRKIALESLITSDTQRLNASLEKKQQLDLQNKLNEEELQTQKTEKDIKNDGKFKKICIFFAFLTSFLLISTILLFCFRQKIFGFVVLGLTILSAIGAIVFLIKFLKTKGAENEKPQNQKAIEKSNSLNAESMFVENEINNFQTALSQNLQKLEQLKQEFSSIFGCEIEKFDFSRANKQMSALERRLVELSNDKKHIFEQIDAINDQKFELGENIFQKEASFEEINKKMDILSKTSKFLEEAKNSLSNRFIDPVSAQFDQYYRRFLADGEGIVLDANLKMRMANFCEIDFLSAGLFDLVHVCKRLALVDLLFKKEKPPIILDDPFANFDDQKVEIAKGILKEKSNDYQIIAFTCQKNRA